MIDKFTTHQILIQRLGNGTYKDITPILKQLRDDINAQLLSRSIPLSQNTQQLLKQLNNIIDNGITQLSDELINRLNEFAVYEQEFTLKLLDNTTVTTVAIGTGAGTADIASIIATSRIRFPGKKSMTIADLINTFSSAYKDDIKSIIDLGIVNGETTDVIASQIKKLTDTRTIAQARAVVLTSTNHAGAMARRAAWQPYHKLFAGERYDAVLDSRTTIICASLDGKIFPFNEGPQCPLHYNCRSVRIPQLKPEYDLNIESTRASSSGPVSAKLTYSEWLARQNKAVQNEVLGKTRAEAFRKGEIKIEQFINNKGATLTLEQLRKKDLL